MSRKLGAIHYTQPGKPQQDAYVARYNRTVRTEWLRRYHFNSIEDVQEHATRWLWTYNNERPKLGDRKYDPSVESESSLDSTTRAPLKEGIVARRSAHNTLRRNLCRSSANHHAVDHGKAEQRAFDFFLDQFGYSDVPMSAIGIHLSQYWDTP